MSMLNVVIRKIFQHKNNIPCTDEKWKMMRESLDDDDDGGEDWKFMVYGLFITVS